MPPRHERHCYEHTNGNCGSLLVTSLTSGLSSLGSSPVQGAAPIRLMLQKKTEISCGLWGPLGCMQTYPLPYKCTGEGVEMFRQLIGFHPPGQLWRQFSGASHGKDR